jgi:hypothetical protein
VDIISIAQQAKPKDSVQRDDFLAMANSWSVEAVMIPGSFPPTA